MCIPTDGVAFLNALADAVVQLGDIPAEVHHTHIFANTFPLRCPILEVHYENAWRDGTRRRQQWGRADLWAPPGENTRQLYVEVKRARLYDRASTRVGPRQYGLVRAAPDWALDVWRLLVGPSNPSCCGFLLCVYSNDGSDLFPGWPPTQGPLLPLAPDAIDADEIYDQIAALVGETSTVTAIQALAQLVVTRLQGRVIRLGGPRIVRTRSDGTHLAADPLLFEWEQEGAQRAADRVDALVEP